MKFIFAHTSFKWSNLASNNAGVTVVIVGLSRQSRSIEAAFSDASGDGATVKEVENINAYLVPGTKCHRWAEVYTRLVP